ncbi:MAG TPA: hypothetical protein VEZ90_05765 [Blastocatellia bacterium]|nr:hypothetical protein [Blastocatellia bacterium]
MISRHWTGLAKHECSSDYVTHLQTQTFPELSRIPGFVDGSILKRTLKEGVEFLIVTNWDSVEAIRTFAGETEDAAVVPAVVQAMMVRYDIQVRHYDAVFFAEE